MVLRVQERYRNKILIVTLIKNINQLFVIQNSTISYEIQTMLFEYDEFLILVSY